jgi:hypothetical protein
MARMGVNPMQGLGANPMGSFLGQQQLPPQVAALAPTRQSLEAQVSDCRRVTQERDLSECHLQFSSQLQQLEAMGFVNRDQNIQALTLTGGNVEAAVDRILSGNFN